MNLDGIQRTLFRMQLDPGFCSEVLGGSFSPTRELGEVEWALIRAVDPRCFRADAQGGRREQLLGNLSLEAPCTSAHWVATSKDGQGLHAFLGSDEFHRAVARGDRIPMAFAEWLESQGAPPGLRGDVAAAVRASTGLEATMIRARRLEDSSEFDSHSQAGKHPTVALSPLCSILELPAGCLEWVGRCTAAAAVGGTLPTPRFDPGSTVESLLIQASQSRSAGMGLREVQVEVLEGAAGAVISASARGLTVEARAELARELGAQPEDLEEFVESLVEDGVLRHH